MGNTEAEFPNPTKELPIRKKTVLRDLQNDNRVIVPNSNGKTPFLKGRETNSGKFDEDKVSGTKRMSPEYPMNPNNHQSSSNNAANGHLVYVRRKSEAELIKSVSCETGNVTAHGMHATQLLQDEASQLQSKTEEPKISCLPVFSPLPAASSMHSSGKRSVPPVPRKTALRLATTDSNCPAISVPNFGNPNCLQYLHWEEQYHRLLMILRKIDQLDQEEYIQMLQSLSSVELNRRAIELEKRSIQLSLEEAKELKCVGDLNVLGKPINSKVPADQA